METKINEKLMTINGEPPLKIGMQASVCKHLRTPKADSMRDFAVQRYTFLCKRAKKVQKNKYAYEW